MLYFSRWKTTLIWMAVLAGVVFAFPNLLSREQAESLPGWLPNDQMTLGLDLQGGSHILLEVDRAEIAEERVNTVLDETRRILRDAGIGYTGLGASNNTVQVNVRDQSQLEEARRLLATLAEPVSAGGFAGGMIQEVTLAGPDNGRFRLSVTTEGIDYRVSTAVSQSIEVVRRRVDELGTTEPIIQRQGVDRIVVQVPGLDDPERLKELLNQTARLSFRMVDPSMPVEEAINGRPPATSEILYSADDTGVPYLIERRELVSGENLIDAQTGFDQRTNEPIVTFRFDGTGAQRFGQATQRNVGRPFAIVLDEQVISAPVINEPILGGSGQISGNFTVQSANDLAILLRAGALPATLTVIEERTVGPGLGQDSIEAGTTAAIIGAILVIAFMFVAYGLLGFVANIALIVNVVLIIAILSAIGATLTLPGIAGIVLTIGMAVDSNVLIYERMREENRAGRSLVQTIDAGFTKAFGTILDANITTLIAALTLFYLGSGPVRGFAITLAIGIVTTVFTAFTVTRWLIAEWVRRRRPKKIPEGFIGRFIRGTSIDFMTIRRWAFTFSAATSVAAIVGFATISMNFGIDFRGGSLIEVQSRGETAEIADIRSSLSGLGFGEVQVQEFGSPRDALIRIQAQDGGEAAQQAVIGEVRTALADDYEFRRIEVVGPTVSGELAQIGTIAVLSALFAILVYVWFRFEWQFALGTIVASVHDVMLTIGMFVLLGLEFNLASIAAVLTTVGYSLNDSIVIYDRVRENLRRYKKMPLMELINISINEMLPRTILTSVSTLFALFALFIFGGEVLRSFTAAMIFGVVVGTYSSIFIGGPVLVIFKLRREAVMRESDTEAEEERQAAKVKAPAGSTA